ncbi:cell envelope integrity protein CreD [Blastomonas sp. SL216]|uniref:cell envelope integrity protein CreD n=1 Tax=Blastomonas sp. SL216 TaxID=2995169 RepID=UPI0023772308|nr:cell envelope integrity protein CreD [Blastomonas sp. SL216]
MAKERSPGFKLGMTVLIGALLAIPLFMVYALVWDRQSQSETARASVAEGWGGPQMLAGPVMVIPYRQQSVETVTENGRETSRAVTIERELLLAPVTNTASVDVEPERRTKSIYETVVYEARVKGKARFALPEDLERFGVNPEELMLDRAEIRVGISDARGLLADNALAMAGKALPLRPGKGLGATNGSGFFAFADWSENAGAPVDVAYRFGVRGNGQLMLIPDGEATDWTVRSHWPHPSFAGQFLPNSRRVTDKGFSARYKISNLALGRAIVQLPQPGEQVGAGAQMAQIDLIEPVNFYSQVDRAVKYGFLFIGFTFLAFLMFDIIAGARVAAAEYLLTGAGLILFFVLLLAFAEIIGFTLAYLLASGAIIGLISAYSAAVLGSAKRAGFIAGLLLGLYALLYVLLNLEAYSLLIGSVLLFVALAAVMYVTRRVDWSGLGKREEAAGSA